MAPPAAAFPAGRCLFAPAKRHCCTDTACGACAILSIYTSHCKHHQPEASPPNRRAIILLVYFDIRAAGEDELARDR